MQLIRGLINLNHQADACVATIGNFDGVHLGHRAIIKRVIEDARESGHRSCVILFEPHPKEFFMGDSCPARITNFTEKYLQLKALGVDKLLLLKFNQSLCQMQASDFIQKILIEQLRIQHLVVGDDFQFGYQRKGNYELLRSQGKGHYTVEPTPSVFVDDPNLGGEKHRASSTLVRKALAENDLSFAEQLLERRYRMTGKVGYGQQLGRQIGFPTANIALNRRKPALAGVYLVKAQWLDNRLDGEMQFCWGVANCGSRPTVDGQGYRLEVHLLGISPDLYGIELEIEFHAFLRGEKKFDDIDGLTEQIKQDVKQAEKLIDKK